VPIHCGDAFPMNTRITIRLIALILSREFALGNAANAFAQTTNGSGG
jgi:hypothetical protein